MHGSQDPLCRRLWYIHVLYRLMPVALVMAERLVHDRSALLRASCRTAQRVFGCSRNDPL